MAFTNGTNGPTRIATADWQGVTTNYGATTAGGAYPSDGSVGYIPEVWAK